MEFNGKENISQEQKQELKKLLAGLAISDNIKLERDFVSLEELSEIITTLLLTVLETDANIQVRHNAAIALGKLGNKKAFEALKVALHDSNSYIRSAAAIALGELGDKNAVGILCKAIKDKDASVSSQAAFSLAKISDKSITDFLINLLQHERDYVRFNALSVLGSLKDERSIPSIIKVLEDDKSNWVRSEGAAIALGKMGGQRVVNPLTTALCDQNDSVRFYSALALGWLGNLAALPALQQIYENDTGSIRGGYDSIKDAAYEAIKNIKQANGVSE